MPYLREPPPTFSFWQDIGFSLSFIGLALFPIAVIGAIFFLMFNG